MNRSVKKRYITWLLFVLNILCILYIFLNVSCVQINLKTIGIKCLFYHGYKFGVNELKATEGVTIFVY